MPTLEAQQFPIWWRCDTAVFNIVDILDKKSVGVILQPYCGDEKYPPIESFEILNINFKIFDIIENVGEYNE